MFLKSDVKKTGVYIEKIRRPSNKPEIYLSKQNGMERYFEIFIKYCFFEFRVHPRPGICVKYFLSFSQQKPVSRENSDKLNVHFF